MVEGQLQSIVIHTAKRIGYDNVKELQFEVINKVITGNNNNIHMISHGALYIQLLNFSLF